MGIKYNKDRAKNRFILVILDLSNNLATLTSKTLEKKDNEIIKHKATTVILVSYDPKKNEDKKITKEKLIAISRPSINGRKSFKLKSIFFLEVLIFVWKVFVKIFLNS